MTLPISAKTDFAASNSTSTKPRTASDIVTLAAAIAFLLLNAVKLSLFNLYLLPKQTAAIFDYKLLVTVLLVVIIYPLLYKLRSRVLLSSAYILQTVYIIVNLAYYKYFRSYLHIVQSLSLLKEGMSIAGNSAVPLTPEMLIAFIDLPFLIIVLARGFKGEKFRKGLRTAFTVAVAASLCAVAAIEVVNYDQGKSIVNLVHDTYSGESPVVERYGTIADNAVNLYYNSSNKAMASQLKYGGKITNERATNLAGAKVTRQAAVLSTASNAAAASASSAASGAATVSSKPNYVIVQVESMDANIVNQQYKGQYITPFLHSLENSSIYYPYCMSYHEGGGTSDSEFSVMDSVEPLQYYPALKLSSYSFPNSLVSKLDAGQYSTYAFHGNVGSFYNRDVAFPKMGFQQFYDMLRMKLPENGWGLPDNEVFDYTFNKIKTVKQPFMSYTITMTSHEPFNSARHYYNNSLYDDIQDTTVKNYYNSFSYVDQSLKSFVEQIQKNFKNTYVIIYGDHTPNINTDMYKQASFTMDNRYFEFVPMFVITPDGKARKESGQVASFLDVSPTVLETSGIRFDVDSNGQNLTAPALKDDSLPFKGGSYKRSLLFQRASATPAK